MTDRKYVRTASAWRLGRKRDSRVGVISARGIWRAKRRGMRLEVSPVSSGGFYFTAALLRDERWNSLWTQPAFKTREEAMGAAELFADLCAKASPKGCLKKTSDGGAMGICMLARGHEGVCVPGWCGYGADACPSTYVAADGFEFTCDGQRGHVEAHTSVEFDVATDAFREAVWPGGEG